ncbi:MAG TPA: MBL fold metallo-hydrolase [Thermoanaerobaculia bacterium]|nr:MBL fold metallo-hydrolase [Thermoanaerobaculia bacterium]
MICSLFAVAVAAAPVEIAPGVHLLRGAFVPGRQPDGNTVIFTRDGGAIVVDTGRHAAHTRAILDFAKPKAVINTHWHLDHIGGNALIRREVPGVKIYASAALDDALKGFLASYAKQLEDVITKTSGEEQQRYRTELALIQSGKQLAPDEVVTETRVVDSLEIHLEKDAVTAGDLWILDKKTGTLVAGDLVTLPVPFLDTAKPLAWKDALARLSKVDFTRLVPGHGPVMTRDQFAQYRTAYDNLLACAASSRTNEECSNGWLKDAGDLLADADPQFTRQMLGYYLDQHLRAVVPAPRRP